MKESVWVEDKNITECKGCATPFSVSRRKVSFDTLRVHTLHERNSLFSRIMTNSQFILGGGLP